MIIIPDIGEGRTSEPVKTIILVVLIPVQVGFSLDDQKILIRLVKFKFFVPEFTGETCIGIILQVAIIPGKDLPADHAGFKGDFRILDKFLLGFISRGTG